ncbi:MAG TPA: LysM domain-containing protein, partial [Thermoleophilaceae bacterium]|nr:LysM domain-containing protein [Thermoleophilaceae bacterium]
GPVDSAAPAPTPRKRVAPIRHQRETRADPKRARPAPRFRRPVAPVRAPSGAPVQAPPASAPAPVTTPSSKAGSEESHTVQAGETLWSIASARLGPGASAAQIAREVQRIWDLNARAIGTGDPSLIGVGVQLRFD